MENRAASRMDAVADWAMHVVEDLRGSVTHVFGPYYTAEHILKFCIIFTFLSYLFDLYLQYRQHRIYMKHEFVPNEYVSIMDQKSFAKSRLYNIDKSVYSMIRSTWGMILSELTLVYFLNAVIWNVSGTALSKMGLNAKNEYLHLCMYMWLSTIWNSILSLPWSIYATFVIEERHGFNKQTAGFFAKDKAKAIILSQVLMCPIFCVVHYILKSYGQMAFFYVWLAICVFSIFLITIYPNFIAPIFDTFKPLPAGELRTEIEALASSVGFPLGDIKVVESSKRSSHSNAYFVGLFKKSIVLYDTLARSYHPDMKKTGDDVDKEEGDYNDDDNLLRGNAKTKDTDKGCTDEEVLAVLCHEIGHWKYSHTTIMLCLAQIHIFVGCLTFSLFTDCKPLFEAFGFFDEQPAFLGLVLVFGCIYKPVDKMIEFLTMYISRRFEFQADDFVRKMHRASYLREALITLNKDNLSFPITDWLDSAFKNSHPTVLERLEALGKTD